MRKKHHFIMILFLMLAIPVLTGTNVPLAAEDTAGTNGPLKTANVESIEEKVRELMDTGDIPGLSLVIVRGGEPVYMKGFGYRDLDAETPVTADTLFELCSNSKAFTALAVLKLEADGLINLDAPVSNYLSWFHANYKGEKKKITLRQLLHQTSGIPFKSVAKIPVSDAPDALQQTVRNLVGIELVHEPGSTFLYATVNYDILGAVLEQATGMAYEDYMSKEIFRPLGLNHTFVGTNRLGNRESALGYKIGFFKPRRYEAPVYRGNNPAGYIYSNAHDMARWLKLQLGLERCELSPLIERSQQRNDSVRPTAGSLLSYAMGWQVSLDGSGDIMHSGGNPNFTTHVIYNPQARTGVAVLANSNSQYTPHIAQVAQNLLLNRPLPPELDAGGIDKSSSVISMVLGLYLLCVVGFLLWTVLEILKGARRFAAPTLASMGRLLGALVMLLPFALGVYLLPYMMAEVPWETALVWTPSSFKIAALMILGAMGCSYLAYAFSSLFPQQNKYLRSIPFLLIISLLSGGANAAVIFLISMSLYMDAKLSYMLFYFGLAGLLYLVGRKVLQGRLVNMTFDIIYDLRMRLIDRIFSASYQKYERLESGRLIATLNNDTTQLGGAANVLVAILSSLITVVGAFLYLAAIAFWATLVTVVVIAAVATIYSMVSQKAAALFNISRDTQNDYLGLLNGMNDGFKELSLHSAKKVNYREDVREITAKFRDASSGAMLRFVNAFMVGESMLIMVLGAVAFGIPVLLPDVGTPTLMSFIMVLLYLIGPVTGILNSIPQFVQIKIAWDRVQGLMKDLPAEVAPFDKARLPVKAPEIKNLKAEGVFFKYESEDESETFSVGPLDFEAEKGEIIFVVGGNGSGKTTLAKLLTGLYIPSEGKVSIDGEELDNSRLGEYFSVVFNDYHLFEKLYDVNLEGKEEELDNYLKMLRLSEKVKVEDNRFSTVDLSGGQRKRLALLRCYLEERPIYLLDEVAADQDPEFRKFFYRNLLVKMREKGKTVIAITHDDHYFDVADRVIKMDMGKVDLMAAGSRLNVTN